jgi:hypothetical protein
MEQLVTNGVRGIELELAHDDVLRRGNPQVLVAKLRPVAALHCPGVQGIRPGQVNVCAKTGCVVDDVEVSA